MPFINSTWLLSPVVRVDLPAGVHHLDLDSSWCDPLIKVDTSGEELVLHRQGTSNSQRQ